MHTSLSDSYFRDQWILDSLENEILKLDFKIDEDGTFHAYGRLNINNDTIDV